MARSRSRVRKSAVEKLSKQIKAIDTQRARERAEFNIEGCTPAEEQFAVVAANRGKRVFRSGWPDFLVLDQDTGGLVFVEVKTRFDRVHESQEKMFSVLEAAGLRVCVWRPEEPHVLVPWRRFLSMPRSAPAPVQWRNTAPVPLREDLEEPSDPDEQEFADQRPEWAD